MEREGKTIGTDSGKLQKRRLADGRNAFRKMDRGQRVEFLMWIADEHLGDSDAGDHAALASQCLKEGK